MFFTNCIKRAQIFFLLLFLTSPCYSQEIYKSFYDNMNRRFPDQRLVNKERQKYINLYEKTHNSDYLAFTKIIDVVYIKPEDSLKDLRKAYEIIKTFEPETSAKAEGYFWTAVFLEKSSLDLSKKYLEQAVEINQKNQNYCLLPSNYHILGRNYYKRGNYSLALTYFNKALQLYKKQGDTTAISSMYNNFGLAYAKMKRYPLAIKNTKTAISMLLGKKKLLYYEKEFLNSIKVNLGNFYYDIKDYKNALKNYEEVFAFCQKHPDLKGNLHNIIQNLYVLYKDNPAKLKEYTANLIQFLDNNNDSPLNIQILKILQKDALERGNIFDARNYSLKLNRSYDLHNAILLKKRRETTDDLNKYLIASVENEQYISTQKEKIKSIILYFVIALLATGLFYFFKVNRLNKEKAQIKNDLLEKEKGLILERMQHLNLNLDLKSKTEAEFLYRLKKLKKEKNFDAEEIIKDLHLSISNLLNIDRKQEVEIQKKSILNDTFLQKLAQDFPELTSPELQLCGYIHLSLSNKEIALLQNLTPPSVRVYKTRLKTKLGLNKEQDLEFYLKTKYL